MPRVRCPKCSTVVEVAPGEAPVCPTCGFGARPAPAPAAPSYTPPSYTPPLTGPPTPPSPAPLAGPSDPWGAAAGHEGYGAPTAPGAARTGAHGGPPGTPRSPGLVVLFYALSYLVTLGAFPFYAYYWYWKTGDEVDRFRGDRHVGSLMRPAVIVTIVGTVIAAIAGIAMFGAIMDAFENIDDEDAQAEDLDSFEAMALGAQVAQVVGAIVGIVGYVLLLIAMWRLWTVVAEEQRALGNARPLQPGMLLLYLLSPLIAIPVGFALFITIIGIILIPFLVIAVFVLLVLAYVQTQNALNGVWVAHGARPA